MRQRNEEFMKLYEEYRYLEQVNFYTERSEEFKEAYSQFLTWSGVIMILTAGVSAATAAITSTFWTPILAILAVGLPALSTALAAYNELLAFERQSKLYEDTEKALHTAHAESPDHKRGLNDNDYAVAVGVYVNMIEGIFQKEQGQWGQLQSQAKMVELPAAKTTEMLEEESAKKETGQSPARKAGEPSAEENTGQMEEAPMIEDAPKDSGAASSIESEQDATEKPEDA
jgi:SMODS and SLOG-associating 2TM effector domain 1